MASSQTAPSLALAAYTEDLVTGRRVVVFGNALSGLAETLVERGARLVHVYDEEPVRVSEAAARSTSAAVSHAPLTPGGIAARDGAFDVGFVDDLGSFGDPAQLVTRLRRALSARGVAFVWTKNPDVSPIWPGAEPAGAGPSRRALGYYDLYDLVSTQFDEVRMVGQTPFVGFALADFSPDSESEFSIDTGFVPGGAEEPERYVAVCSHFPVSIEPFCVVQMAAGLLVGKPHERSNPRHAPSSASGTTGPREASAKPGEASSKHGETSKLGELEQRLAAETAAKTKLEQLLKDVNAELLRRDEWVQELESRAATADERADAAEAALENAQRKLARAEAPRPPGKEVEQLSQLQAQLREQTLTNERHAQSLQTIERELAESRSACENLKAQLRESELAFEQRTRELARVESARARAQEALAQVEAERDEARATAKANDAAALQLEELQHTVTTLREQVTALRSDLHLAGDEIARAEEQLATQGQAVRQLRADLAETERFAALLVAEREDWVRNAQPKAETEQTLAASPMQAPPPVHEDDRGEEASRVAVSSDQSPTEESSSEEPVSALGGVSPSRREAELEAALQGTKWMVEELESRLAEGSREPELLERLYKAEGQLQRQATLIEQYERSVAAKPSSGLGVSSGEY